MNNKSSKKGAVEMSLNLIIMLIIGMVVLGLVIGFVNSLVSKGTANFDKQLGDNEKLKLDKIKNCPDVFCVDPNPSITIKKGSKSNVFIKIRNVGSSPSDVDVPVGDASDKLIIGDPVDDSGNIAASSFILTGPGFDGLNAGDEIAQMYTLKVADTTTVGTYYVSFGVNIGTKDYKKVITVNVE